MISGAPRSAIMVRSGISERVDQAGDINISLKQ